MKVNYVSKDEAIKSIERKVPSVLESFEKYGIKNPLPATVYVLFDNNKDYEKLKAVITLYE
jgi:cell division protein FtsX